MGLLGPSVYPTAAPRSADYGEKQNPANRTQIFRQKSGILILDEARILNSRPYTQNGENRRKNHGEEEGFLGIDEMRENLFRPFREIPIIAVIFRPPEATCWNRRDFGEFILLNLVRIPTTVPLVVMSGRRLVQARDLQILP